MKNSVFSSLNHFNRNEAWGDPDKVSGVLLLLLDEIRERLGKSIVVNTAYSTKGHSANSRHYVGDAVDFHVLGDFLEVERRLQEIFEELNVSDKIGFGIYPDWYRPGFHLDTRGSKARWGRIGHTYVGYEKALQYTQKKVA